MKADAQPTEPDWADAPPIPISALQHAVYCMRQAALIHLERLWSENRFTAEGQVMHHAVDRAEGRKVRGVRRVTALPVASTRLGIAGVADCVEFHVSDAGERPFPIEYKRGRPKAHDADNIQLCAQALCLEDMTGQSVPGGALYYGATKRRTDIIFDAALRQRTEAVIDDLRALFANRQTPVATYEASRCKPCSLLDLCQPKIIGKPATTWRRKMLLKLLNEGDREQLS